MNPEEITEAEVWESVHTTQTHLEKAAEQIVWQVENEVWKTIGYDDWDAMREGVYGGAAVIVPRRDRPELSSRLRAQGLTKQEIGDTLGKTERTIERDLKQTNVGFSDTTITNSRGQQRPASYERRHISPEPTSTYEPSAPPPSSPPPPSPQPEPGPFPQPEPEAVADYVDSGQEVQNARYLEQFMRQMVKADDFLGFDADRVGRIADPDVMQSLEDYAQQVTTFTDTARRARSGLHLIQGSQK